MRCINNIYISFNNNNTQLTMKSSTDGVSEGKDFIVGDVAIERKTHGDLASRSSRKKGRAHVRQVYVHSTFFLFQ